MKPELLNPVIHERVRLAAIAALAARGKLSFSELKEILEVTDGNLSVHTSVLEQNGFIKINKKFVGKKPRTTFVITDKGRKAFRNYLAQLERLLKESR